MITVYVDMDGVLSGMDEHYDSLFSRRPATEEEMWSNINSYQKDKEWFFDLPKKTDGVLMWHELKLLEKDYPEFLQVRILTATGDDREKAADEKIRWCREHLPLFKDEDFNWVQSSHNKAEHAHEDAVLIDDREKSIIPFNAAGGYGILHVHGAESLKILLEHLKTRKNNASK